jgi:hypothetical protein
MVTAAVAAGEKRAGSVEEKGTDSDMGRLPLPFPVNGRANRWSELDHVGLSGFSSIASLI